MLTQALLLTALTAQSAPLPKLVGTLSVADGKIRVERAGRDPVMAGRYFRLRLGDRLTIVERPTATASLDATREMWRFPARGSWEVQERALRSLGGEAMILVRRSEASQEGTGRPMGKLAGVIRGDIPVVRPFGAVTTDTVEVSFDRAVGASRAMVDLLDAEGAKLWSQAGVTGTTVTLPADKTRPGVWYQVRVVQTGGGKVVSSSAWVVILTPTERKDLASAESEVRLQLAKEPQALGLALGELWSGYSLVSRLPEALALVFPEYGGPNRTSDDEKAYPWQQGEWLEKAGFPNLAREAYEKAWQAGERAPELKAAIERLGGKADAPLMSLLTSSTSFGPNF